MVALLVSAWIEIWMIGMQQERNTVALLVSAWIEIIHKRSDRIGSAVALLVSAWIEIENHFAVKIALKSHSS